MATALITAVFSLPTIGQTSSAESITESTTVIAVEVPVRVLVDGNPVRGLTRDNFKVLDEKKNREISGFEVVDLSRLTSPGTGAAGNHRVDEPPITARRHFLMLFDLSYAQPTSITRAREAVLELVESGLHPTDLVAVATYSSLGGVNLLHGFTTDRKQVALAVKTLGLPRLIQPAPDPLGLLFGSLADAGSSLNDRGPGGSAFAEALQDLSRTIEQGDRRESQEQIESLSRSFGELANLLDDAPGRKHILYLSEGFDTSSLFGTGDRGTQIRMNRAAETGRYWEIDSEERFGSVRGQNQLEGMLEAFRRADCTFETVDIGGLRRAGGVDQGNRRAVERNRASESGRSDALALIAAGTGGEFIRNFNNLSTALEEVLERTGVTYVLSFHPRDLEPDGSFHRLKVRLENGPKGAKIVHRPGYYAPLPFNATSIEERRLQSAAHLLSGQQGGEIPTAVLAVPTIPPNPVTANTKHYTPVLLEISGPALTEGRQKGQLQVEIFAYALDFEGTIVEHFNRAMTIDLGRTGTKLAASGLKFFGHFDLAPGSYSLRTLVRDSKGRWGLSTSALQVPGFDSPVLLQPLMVEAPGRWLLVREEPDPKAATPAYPFVARGHSFLPAAAPSIAPGMAAAIAITGSGFTGQPQEMDIAIRHRDGSLVSNATARVVDQSLEANGVLHLALTLETTGLAIGSYEMELAAVDPGGQRASTVLDFDVAQNP